VVQRTTGRSHLSTAAFAAASKYKSDSLEQRAKEQAIALWIGRTGLPACTVEDEDFIPRD